MSRRAAMSEFNLRHTGAIYSAVRLWPAVVRQYVSPDDCKRDYAATVIGHSLSKLTESNEVLDNLVKPLPSNRSAPQA